MCKPCIFAAPVLLCNASPCWQLRPALRRGPIRPRHPWPVLPPWRGGRWQRPKLRSHQQLPPAALAAVVHQPYALPRSTSRDVRPAAGALRGHRRALRQGEQVQSSACFTDPAAESGRQVREGHSGKVLDLNKMFSLNLSSHVRYYTSLCFKCMFGICTCASAPSCDVSVQVESHKVTGRGLIGVSERIFTQIYIHDLLNWDMHKTWRHGYTVTACISFSVVFSIDLTFNNL